MNHEHLLHSLFAGAPRTPVPWPRSGRLKHAPNIDPALVNSVLSSPAVLVEVDPRSLHANQPWLLAEHVAYYLTDTWWRTGRTARDQWAVMNRFPLVLPDHRNRLTIVAGHHRAAAAMLRGEPLMARVAPGSWDVPAALTPSVFLGPGDDHSTAFATLRPLGLDDVEIRFALDVARPV
jgi:hypothetical protein